MAKTHINIERLSKIAEIPRTRRMTAVESEHVEDCTECMQILLQYLIVRILDKGGPSADEETTQRQGDGDAPE